MSLTITTADFTGLLGDVIPFARTDGPVEVLKTVNLAWDGEQLHAQATDHFRIAWSSWHPDDDPDEDAQGDIFYDLGSGDDPWSVLVPIEDAVHLVKTYKLPVKEAVVAPLTLDVAAGRLTVKRDRESGHPAITTDIGGLPAEFPDVRGILAKHDGLARVDTIAFTAKMLADFAKVRPRGPFELRFTGDRSPALVTIGERFVGAIQPVRTKND